MTRPDEPRGVSLVEVLVVMGLVALLVGLVFPGLQSAREAARRTRCADNTKQVALAVRAYESQMNGYPVASTAASQPGWQGWSALSKLLPHLELLAIHEHIDFTVNAYSEQPPAAFVAANAAQSYVAIPTFRCPSDVADLGGEMVAGVFRAFPGCNYGLSKGAMIADNPGTLSDVYYSGNAHIARRRLAGPFRSHEGAVTTAAHVRDGTSNTIGVLESLAAPLRSANADPVVGLDYVMGVMWPGAANPPCSGLECSPLVSAAALDGFIADAQAAWAARRDIRRDRGRFWHWASDSGNLMTTLLPPNSPVPDSRAGCKGCGYGEQGTMSTARSRHPGGVVTGLLDGSVRFVTDSVARDVWWAVGSIAGGESVAGDQW